MRASRSLSGSFHFLGSRIPVAVGLLIGLTMGATILAAVGRWSNWPILEYGALVPHLVWRGQVWRLLTWAFIEFSWAPLGLVFASACLLSFGRELTYRWGPVWFLTAYVALATLTGVLTCLVGLVWPTVMAAAYATSWATVIALITAWAIEVPHAQMVFNFLLPVQGRQIIYLNIVLTALAGLFSHPALVVPNFIAIALVMVYMRDPGLYSLWLRVRLATLRRASMRRPSHLRPVERDDWGKPPRWLH